MKTLATLLTGAAFALTGTTAALAGTVEESEAKVARMLDGREAGTPVSCIPALRGSRVDVIEHVGIVYYAGDTIYLARASNANQLDHDDIVVIDRHSAQLCTTDMMRTVDRYQYYTTGSVFLEDFVPYTKAG